jgi:hypothetical protein
VPILGQHRPQNIVDETFTGGSEIPQILMKPVPGAPAGTAEAEVHLGLTVMDRFALEAMKIVLTDGRTRDEKGIHFPDSQVVVDYAYAIALAATAKREMIIRAAASGAMPDEPKREKTEVQEQETPDADER